MSLTDDLHNWADSVDWNHVPEDKYEDLNEHYYCVSDWFEDEQLEMFRLFRRHINQHGKTQLFNGETFQYVTIQGWKYWLSTSYYSNGICLNRRPAEE